MHTVRMTPPEESTEGLEKGQANRFLGKKRRRNAGEAHGVVTAVSHEKIRVPARGGSHGHDAPRDLESSPPSVTTVPVKPFETLVFFGVNGLLENAVLATFNEVPPEISAPGTKASIVGNVCRIRTVLCFVRECHLSCSL